MKPTLLTFTPFQTVEARCAKLEGLLETLKTEHDNNRQEIATVVTKVQTLETAIRHLRDESQQMVEIDGKFYISRQKAVVVVIALQSMLMDLGS